MLGERGLLGGEPVDTDDPEEVEHWLAVYTELVAGARALEADGATIARLGQMTARLDHWRARAASPGDAHPRR